VENYRFDDGPPLSCPITAFSGESDVHVSAGELQAWNLHTTGRFRSVVLPGDHFFAYANNLAVPRQIAAVLNEYTCTIPRI
jgi:surfactin synthase thioesterase subunit